MSANRQAALRSALRVSGQQPAVQPSHIHAELLTDGRADAEHSQHRVHAAVCIRDADGIALVIGAAAGTAAALRHLAGTAVDGLAVLLPSSCPLGYTDLGEIVSMMEEAQEVLTVVLPTLQERTAVIAALGEAGESQAVQWLDLESNSKQRKHSVRWSLTDSLLLPGCDYAVTLCRLLPLPGETEARDKVEETCQCRQPTVGLLISTANRSIACWWPGTEEEWRSGAWFSLSSQHIALPSSLPYPSMTLASTLLISPPPSPAIEQQLRLLAQQRPLFLLPSQTDKDEDGEKEEKEADTSAKVLLRGAPVRIWPVKSAPRQPLSLPEEVRVKLRALLNRKRTIIPYIGDLLCTIVPHRMNVATRSSGPRWRQVPRQFPAAPTQFLFVLALFNVARSKSLISREVEAKMHALLLQGQPLTALRRLVEATRRYQLKDCIQKVQMYLFARNPVPTQVHSELQRLNMGIVMVSSFDELLSALSFSFHRIVCDSRDFLDILADLERDDEGLFKKQLKGRILFKLHGTISKENSIVDNCRDDHSEQLLTKLLEGSDNTILFIGCSLEECKSVVALKAKEEARAQHVALVPGPVSATWVEANTLLVVQYVPDANHSQINHFLHLIANGEEQEPAECHHRYFPMDDPPASWVFGYSSHQYLDYLKQLEDFQKNSSKITYVMPDVPLALATDDELRVHLRKVAADESLTPSQQAALEAQLMQQRERIEAQLVQDGDLFSVIAYFPARALGISLDYASDEAKELSPGERRAQVDRLRSLLNLCFGSQDMLQLRMLDSGALFDRSLAGQGQQAGFTMFQFSPPAQEGEMKLTDSSSSLRESSGLRTNGSASGTRDSFSEMSTDAGTSESGRKLSSRNERRGRRSQSVSRQASFKAVCYDSTSDASTARTHVIYSHKSSSGDDLEMNTWGGIVDQYDAVALSPLLTFKHIYRKLMQTHFQSQERYEQILQGKGGSALEIPIYKMLCEKGEVVQGKEQQYLILNELDAGGFSRVYRGKVMNGPKAGKKVVLKVPYPSSAKSGRCLDVTALREYDNEAAALELLRGIDSIVSLEEYVKNYHERYLVMDYVPGETLRDFLKQYGKLQMRLQEATTIQIGVQILRSLQLIHDKGIVHFDVKPENIKVQGYDRGSPLSLTLLDLNIARVIGSDTLYTPRNAIGTLKYMSPELNRGRGFADKRADLFATAVLLLECMVADLRLTDLTHFPADRYTDLLCKEFFAKAMAHDVLQRFQDAGTMAEYLLTGNKELLKTSVGGLRRAKGVPAPHGLLAPGVLISAGGETQKRPREDDHDDDRTTKRRKVS